MGEDEAELLVGPCGGGGIWRDLGLGGGGGGPVKSG